MCAKAKTKDTAIEIENLRDEIRRHEHLYFVLDAPGIHHLARSAIGTSLAT